MSAQALYAKLISEAEDFDAFDRHVVACVCALSFAEALEEGTTVCEAVGLDSAELSRLMVRLFPKSSALFLKDGEVVLQRLPEELSLLDLLTRCSTSGSSFEALLALIIARRAQRPHHLWQDLGLPSRRDLSILMTRHFAPLASRNTKDMKWKKFLYRTICSHTGYSLCTAPSCSECDDFANCFEEESGENLLARLRLAADAA